MAVVTFTVDASVFLNAFNSYETGHEESRLLLFRMQERGSPIIVLTLLLPEVAAVVRRGRNNAGLARRFAAQLRKLPHMMLVPLDDTLARQAADVAAQHGLRGSDAVYAAVALRFGSGLVTLDREQQERVAAVIPSRQPAEALVEWLSRP